MRRTLAAGLCLAALACAPSGGKPSNPFVPETRFVLSVSPRGGYLDTTLAGKPEMRFFFPASENCAAILRPEAQVEYSARGRHGEVNNPDPEGKPCMPMGIGNLGVWRQRGPRPVPYGVGGTPLPRKTARFEEVWRDEAEIFLRGRWPLASFIGFGVTSDLVAVVPNIENCRRAIADGQATMEYHYSGHMTYSLMMKPPAKCAIVGFAVPMPKARSKR